MEDYILVTKEGKAKLEEEYTELTTIRKQEVAERLATARAFGDLSENAEYDAAKNEQQEVETRIQELEYQLNRLKLIDEESIDTSTVNLGAHVKLKALMNGQVMEFKLTGTTESNPFEGKISNESPVGAAIIGHKVGDVVEVEVRNRDEKVKYEILEISKK